jgi:hypothetical protein
MEACALWQEPELKTCARLADLLRHDADFVAVGALYCGQQDFDITALVTELAMKQAVPFLPVLCYNESGMRKRAIWEEVWRLQRQEDAWRKGRDSGPAEIHEGRFPEWPRVVPARRTRCTEGAVYPHIQVTVNGGKWHVHAKAGYWASEKQ